MEINFINNSGETEWDDYEKYVAPLLKRTLKVLDIDKKVAVSIVLVKKSEIKRFNYDFRNIDSATDVLSFPDGEVIEHIFQMGDIIVSVDAIVSQSLEYGHSKKREFSFLIVHGFLHLFGYDHQTHNEEQEMIALQKEILDGLADRSV